MKKDPSRDGLVVPRGIMPFEQPKRLVRRVAPSSNSLTPLQDLKGIVTPSDLHYERHHTGVPIIDPDEYTLRIEGMVEHPTTFTLKDLQSFPEHSELRTMECGSNGGRAFAGIKEDRTPQQIDGRVSTSEWVGLYMSTLFDTVGVKDGATWFRAEGHDGRAMYSSHSKPHAPPVKRTRTSVTGTPTSVRGRFALTAASCSA